SAGRVQSVALKMIIDREKEIENFKPEEYWSIDAQFEKDKDIFEGSFYGVDGKKRVLNTEKDVKEITEMMSGRKFTVDKVTKRERKRKAAKPFTTSSIQQEAARKLNFR